MKKRSGLRSADRSLEFAVADLIAEFSIEALPREVSKVADFRAYLPEGTRVYVPFTAGEAHSVVEAAEKLKSQRMTPVPHIAARRIESETALVRFVRALSSAGVTQVLLIGGDRTEPAGPFSSSIDVLRTGVLEGSGIVTFGVAGHPEGHPTLSESELGKALIEKHEYAKAKRLAMHITTQFLFESAPVMRWYGDVVSRIVPEVPIDVGLPGLAKPSTLLRFARDCGVAASMHMLAKNVGWALRLTTAFSPDETLVALAAARHLGKVPQVRTVHFYPFGSFERTCTWLKALSACRMSIDRGDSSIEVW